MALLNASSEKRNRSSNAFMHVIRLTLVFTLAITLAGCKSTLYSKLSEEDANVMVAALANAGLSVDKDSADEKTWALKVNDADFARAVDVLKAQGLPRESHPNMGQVFKREGLVSSPTEERVRFIYALSQDIAKTLTQFDGVITARVHVVIPHNDPLADKVKPSSASVFVKHRPEFDLQPHLPSIRNLVVRGIEGLTVDNVYVSLVPAEPIRHDDARLAANLQANKSLFSILSVVTLVSLMLLALTTAYILIRCRVTAMRDIRRLFGMSISSAPRVTGS
jgi:type III secretion protein J